MNNVSRLLTITLFLFLNKSILATPFTILHTNDLHSHFEGSGPDFYAHPHKLKEKHNNIMGHYARLATLIKKHHTANSILVDAGDFYSGSLFHILGPRKDNQYSPELEFFSFLKYDAVTLGNHEFDAMEEGLLTMINKLPTSDRPHFLLLNLPPDQLAKTPFVKSIIKNIADSSNGTSIRIGIIGLMGDDAVLVSDANRKKLSLLRGKPLLQELQQEIDRLRQQEKVNVIVVIAHAGTPEDEKIVKKVSGINVFIAGHTHELYTKPKIINSTIIAQTGSYGKNLGKLELDYSPTTNNVTLLFPENKPYITVDATTLPDEQYLLRLAQYKLAISKLLDHFAATKGFTYDSKIFIAEKEMLFPDNGRALIGEFVTNGLLEELNIYCREKNLPTIDLYFTSLSHIREPIMLYQKQQTEYQFSDIFRLQPLGFDDQLIPGSPVVTFYLSKYDLRKLIDAIELYSKVSENFTPALSTSLRYDIRSFGIPFINRLKNLKLNGKEFADWPELVHVATTKYVAYYVQNIQDVTYGLVHIKILDRHGKEVKEFTDDQYPRTFVLLANYLKKKGQSELSQLK